MFVAESPPPGRHPPPTRTLPGAMPVSPALPTSPPIMFIHLPPAPPTPPFRQSRTIRLSVRNVSFGSSLDPEMFETVARKGVFCQTLRGATRDTDMLPTI